MYANIWNPYVTELYHYGIPGQKWGVRRYQYPDPDRRWTTEGKKRYGRGGSHGVDNDGDIKKKRTYNKKVEEHDSKSSTKSEDSEKKGLTEDQKKVIKVAAGVAVAGLATAGVVYAAKKGYIAKGANAISRATQDDSLQVELLSLNPDDKSSYLLTKTKAGKKIISDIWDDGVVEEGTIIQNIGTNKAGPQYSRMYGTTKTKDSKFYDQAFVTTNNRRYKQKIYQQIQKLKNEGLSESSPEIAKLRNELAKSGGKQDQYKTTFRVNTKGQTAGYNTGSMEFSNWWNETDQNTRNEVLERAKYAINTNKNSNKSMSSVYDRFTKAIDDRAQGKIDDAEWRKILRRDGYKLYNNTVTYEYTNPTGKTWGGTDEFFDRLKAKGYIGLKDYNDQALSAYKTENPTIFYKGREGVDAVLDKIETRKIKQTEKDIFDKDIPISTPWGKISTRHATQWVKTEPDRLRKQLMKFSK